MSGGEAAKVQEAAAWVGEDTRDVQFTWPPTMNLTLLFVGGCVAMISAKLLMEQPHGFSCLIDN